jgi:glycosyltransferase involved in cell wall biosynthesis
MDAAKPHILHVIDNTLDGGTKVVVLTIFKQLADRYRFTLVNLGQPGRFSKTFTDNGFKVIELGTRLGKWYPLDFIPLARIARDCRASLLHLCLFKSALAGSLAAKFCRLPYIVHDHTSMSDAALANIFPSPLVRTAFHSIYGIAVRNAAAVFALTPYDSEIYIARYKVPPEKVTTIFNPVDIAGLGEAAGEPPQKTLREELKIGDQTRIVLFVGRLAMQKDPFAFVQTAERFSEVDTAFVMAGSGPLETELKSHVRHKGIRNVFFLGYREDVPSLFRQADVLLLTSLWEAFCLVILEAMALGCPVLSTANSGSTAIIQDGTNGLLAPVRDISTLECHLRHILSHPEERKRIIQNGLETAKQFHVTAYAKRLRSCYESILETN